MFENWSPAEILVLSGFVFAAIIILFLWIGPGKALIKSIAERGGSVEARGIRAEVQPPNPDAPAAPSGSEEPPMEADLHDEDLPKPHGGTQGIDLETMEAKIRTGNLVEAERQRDQLKRETAGTPSPSTIEGYYLYCLAKWRGDTRAFEELREKADENTDNPFVQGMVADSYDRTNRHDLAVSYWNRAVAIDSPAQVTYAVHLAKALRKTSAGLDGAVKALARLAQTGDSNQAHYLRAIARILEDDGQKVEAAMAMLHLAREHPAHAKSLFGAAYKLAGADWSEPAVAAYEVYLRAAPDDSAASNNLGLLFSSLGAPNKGYEWLRKGAKAGDAGSAANLASALAADGFEEEALAWVQTAKDLDPTEERIASATATVDRKRSQDDKAAANVRATGEAIAEAMATVFQRLYLGGELVDKPSAGTWIDQSQKAWELSIADNTITLETERYDVPGKRCRGTLTAAGIAELVFEKEEYSLSKKEYEWQKSGDGYLVVDVDSNSMSVIGKARWRSSSFNKDYTGKWTLTPAST